MTAATLTQPGTAIHTCECGKRIPVCLKTLEYIKSGEVVVCHCQAVKS